jgi:hypothetical protein
MPKVRIVLIVTQCVVRVGIEIQKFLFSCIVAGYLGCSGAAVSNIGCCSHTTASVPWFAVIADSPVVSLGVATVDLAPLLAVFFSKESESKS